MAPTCLHMQKSEARPGHVSPGAGGLIRRMLGFCGDYGRLSLSRPVRCQTVVTLDGWIGMGHGHGEDRQRMARVYTFGHQQDEDSSAFLHFSRLLTSMGEQINKIHVYTYIPQAYRQTPMGRPKFNYC